MNKIAITPETKVSATIIREDGTRDTVYTGSNLVLNTLFDMLNCQLAFNNNQGCVAFRTSDNDDWVIGSGLSFGTGTTPPEVTDTALENRTVFFNVYQNSSVVTSRACGPRNIDDANNTSDFYWMMEYTLPPGALNGNYTEYGIGNVEDSEYVVTRSLFRDSQGNPTTLTILETEQLVFKYEIYLKGIPLRYEQTYNVNGTDYLVTFFRAASYPSSTLDDYDATPLSMLPASQIFTNWNSNPTSTNIGFIAASSNYLFIACLNDTTGMKDYGIDPNLRGLDTSSYIEYGGSGVSHIPRLGDSDYLNYPDPTKLAFLLDLGVNQGAIADEGIDVIYNWRFSSEVDEYDEIDKGWGISFEPRLPRTAADRLKLEAYFMFERA